MRAGASPSQNGIVGAWPAASSTQDPRALDPHDPPRGVAEQEDVAGHALDGEVLVERADRRLLRHLDHGVAGVVRDGAAAGDGGQARAAPRLDDAVDAVAVQVRRHPPVARPDPLGQHRDHVVEVGPLQRGVLRRPPHGVEQLVLDQLLARRHGHDLLGQDVERGVAQRDRVEPPGRHRAAQGGQLDQLVAGHREQPAARRGAQRVTGAADPLEQRGHRARRSDLHDEIDPADVDAELERRGGNGALHRAGLEPALRGEAQLARHAAVMGHDLIGAQPTLQRVRDALDQAARVDEHQRGAVLGHQLDDPIVDPPELLVRRDGAQLVVGHLERQIDLARPAGVNDVRIGHGRRRPAFDR